jgi:hypothetical protein
MDIRAVSFQLHLLPPQSRVLALCIICCASLTSFHPSVLGDGPRPECFLDENFFLSSPDLFGCGVRRASAYRALRIEALKAAWEIGIILQPSNENAASCYLLDLLEQCNQSYCSVDRTSHRFFPFRRFYWHFKTMGERLYVSCARAGANLAVVKFICRLRRRALGWISGMNCSNPALPCV